MDSGAVERRLIRFGAFEADLAAGELRKSGVRLKLQEQPFQVLAALLERPGEIVTREELKERLWSGDTFVDFDRGLNTAVNKIREALGDSANHPRFVETVPKRGYRLVAPLVRPDHEENPGPSSNSNSAPKNRRLVFVAGLLALAATAVLLGWSRWNQLAIESSTPEPMPLTAYPGEERSPSFSPDGRQIAFAWQESPESDFNIWVQEVGGQNPRRLTTDTAHDHSPAWSPDGKAIAFLRHREGGVAELLTIPPQGGPESLVAVVSSSLKSPSRLSWSPDGQSLAIDEHGREHGADWLSLISTSHGNSRQLVHGNNARTPAFSPDGTRIAFFTRGHMDPTVAVIDLKDENVREVGRIIEGPGAGLTWTKDGSRILAAAGGRLWAISAAGGQPQPLGFVGRGVRDPALSHSTERVAFSRRVQDGRIWRFDTESPNAAPQPFVPSTHADLSPQFSPDGRRVLFVSNRAGHEAIWVADDEGNNLLKLTDEPIGGTPRWSPDGSLIAFDAPAESAIETFAVRSSGGPRRRITLSPEYDGAPSFSRDGRWIYFSSLRTGKLQIWKVPVEGESETKPAVPITQGGGYAPLESHDGRYVYYVKAHGRADPTYANSIWRVPAEGGKEVVVVEALYSNWGNWALSREALFYVSYEPGQGSDGDAPRQWSVYRYDLEQRKTRKILDVPGEPVLAAPGLDVTADGRWLLYTNRTEQADLYLVEGFE